MMEKKQHYLATLHLNFEDYDKLSNYTNIFQMWLSNTIIDIVLGLFGDIHCEFNNKIKILSCGISGYLLIYENTYNTRKSEI